MEEAASILVVDDEAPLLEGVRLILEEAGYRVLAASDGVDALEVLKSRTVDLILADIAMPRMNGYQLFERVRANPDWVGIPFIFLTARLMDSDVRYAKEMGVDDYLAKPIDAGDVLAVVRGRLRRARQLARRTAPSPGAASPAGTSDRLLVLGTLRIDPGQYRAWMGDEPIQLSAREFVLLEYMAQRVNRILCPRELVQVTHDLDTDRQEAGTLVRPLIRSLRRKLGYPVGDMGCIENIRGVGYRLIPPEERPEGEG